MPLNTTNSINCPIFALAAAVPPAGTITVGYPALGLNNAQNSFDKGNYLFTNNQHKLLIGQNIYSSPKDFTLTFNANSAGITVTNKGTSTWPANVTAQLQLNLSGIPNPGFNDISFANLGNPDFIGVQAVMIDLGSPAAGASGNVAAAQAVAGAKNLTINGTLATNGIAYTDQPRTLQFVSTNAGDTTQTINISGYDKYNQKVSETVTLNGTTVVTSKKALAQVVTLAISGATVGTVAVGTSNVFGLPLPLYKSAVQVLKESQDGAVPTAGTFVNADGSTPTASTGDVRGTYVPNATPNGSIGFAIFALVPDKSDIGVANYTAF